METLKREKKFLDTGAISTDKSDRNVSDHNMVKGGHKFERGSDGKKPSSLIPVCHDKEYDSCNESVRDMQANALLRKSVICCLKDLVKTTMDGETSLAKQSSAKISIVEEGCEKDMWNIHSAEIMSGDDQISELFADPSEVECVATDTSDDEDCSRCESNFTSNGETSIRGELNGMHSQISVPRLACDVCDTSFEAQKCPKEILNHMHTVHKFAVHGLRRDSDGITTRKLKIPAMQDTDVLDKTYHLNESECGSNLQPSPSTNDRLGCVQFEDNAYCEKGLCERTFHSCSLCSLNCTSRRTMQSHLRDQHNCLQGPPLAALALKCRVCKDPFKSVSERSNHEVTQHPNSTAYLLLKCYVCSMCFSSKVCLKKHTSTSHPDQEGFGGPVAFRCRVCCCTFPSSASIQKHFQKLHPSELVFRCPRCSVVLKSRKTYQVHLKNAQCGSMKQECTVCDKIMYSKRAVSIHYRMKHSNSTKIGFSCRICKKAFGSKADRKEHYVADHRGDSPFQCPVCNKGFASKSGMYGHRQTHVKTGVFRCEFCGKEFTRRDSYNEHLLIHTGPRHKCTHCDKEFVQRSNLVRHIRIHTGEKPYKCSFCDKTFSDKGACNSHIKVHTREEACGCPYCGQVFSKKQKLKYHIRKHTGEGLVSCEFCGKTFTNSHSLKEHRMIHDRRTQILCSHCGKAFTTAKYLQRHIAMVHEALLLYRCPLCTRGFSQQGRLKTHLMTHSGIKHLRCLLCTNAYSSRKSLRRHLLNVHGVPIDHPDYKSCFYAMTTEEAGLTLPEIEETSTVSSEPPLLEPKCEALSSESESSSSSDEERESDGGEPPQLERQEPYSFTPVHIIPRIRTKAARKQMPFNLFTPEENSERQRRGLGRPLEMEKSKQRFNQRQSKTAKSTRKCDGIGALPHISSKPKFISQYSGGNFSPSTEIETATPLQTSLNKIRCSRADTTRQSRKNIINVKTAMPCKGDVGLNVVCKTQALKNRGASVGDNRMLGSNFKSFSERDQSESKPDVADVMSASVTYKSNRRARYKIHPPKKRITVVEPEDDGDLNDEYFSD